jgi:uncharacterized lipoprotein
MKLRSSLAAVILVVVVPLLAACSTSRSAAAQKVQEADSSMVAGCTFLGDVSGTSGWGGLAASTGIEYAKNQALDQAAKKGATHVVWNTLAGGMSSSVSGKAYKCPGASPKATP